MSAKIPNVSQLSSRVIRVLGMNPGPMTLQGTNTYILGTGSRRLLLDTGEPDHMEYIENLKQVLNKESISLEHIVLSHWHNDHVGGLKDIFEHINPDSATIWKFKGTEKDEAQATDFVPENKTVQTLTDGQLLKVEGATLRVIHTPGHTTDHIVLKLEEENVVFSGDTILGEGTTVFSDLISYIESLRRIRSLKPDIIYPAHGPVVEEPIKTIDYYIKHREEREQSILKILEQFKGEPKSVEDIVRQMYSDNMKYVFQAAVYVTRKHLDKLLTEGKAIRDEDKNWSIKSVSKL
ncbi:endoribonuclease LACTB2 [Diaphorina citri]|uniref:Beta-lactamase-like protein 2 homolog n=1 Tax=Diaphorina citri TaxID=121845 RepID=A0A3Q0J3Q7_DIACI|nr:endoribonuclease LACTB2 [Diaphorina citri]